MRPPFPVLAAFLALSLAAIVAAGLAFPGSGRLPLQPAPAAATAAAPETTAAALARATADLARIRSRQAGFVPNLGQWHHPGSFRHRAGALTMYLRERGWVLDLQAPRRFAPTPVVDHGPGLVPFTLEPVQVRGAAIQMTFATAGAPRVAGEDPLPGYDDYFLGNDASRWRTAVPRYASVLYAGLYPGIDVRVRSAGGHPEYDLLLAPGADIDAVRIDVDGSNGLGIAADGSLVIATAMGPVTQPVPRTWQVSADGERRALACSYRLLGHKRFGFAVAGWDGVAALTIDPGLIWSNVIGGKTLDAVSAIALGCDGVVTLGGITFSPDYPTVLGSYDRIGNGGSDAMITRLSADGSRLLSSTYLGGISNEGAYAVHVDAGGTITITGDAFSANFPTTKGAFRTTNQGNGDGFVSRLDPRKTGAARLVYSTLFGGSSKDIPLGVFADAAGVVTVTGYTESNDYPTTPGAFDTTFNGVTDAIVTRLDPRRQGAAQLVYSTVLGGKDADPARALVVDPRGVVTICGDTVSAGFPVTKQAYTTSHGGGHDAFVCRLDPGLSAAKQLLYSTLIGGAGDDGATSLSVAADGVTTFGGFTASKQFPTTATAFDTTFGGVFDLFVSRLDPRLGNRQLVYSTLMGGTLSEHLAALAVDAAGVVTFGGAANFTGFPTTPDAHDRLWSGSADGIIAKLDPRRTGAAQLLYSTYLGGTKYDDVHALALTPSGTAIVAGHTASPGFPTTSQAYGTTFRGGEDIFVTHLDMGVKFFADVHCIALEKGGKQNFTLQPGFQYRGMPYLILGSATGTAPGLTLNGVHIPLNWDSYSRLTLGLVSPVFIRFRGNLDAGGKEVAALHVFPFLSSELDLTLHHVLVVLDARSNVVLASDPVPIWLR